MRLFFPSAAKSTVAAPSALLSVAAHAVLIGAAVYGTGVRERALDDALESRVYYLPPPDRVARQTGVEERVQYVELAGAGGTMTSSQPTGHSAGAASDAGSHPGGAMGEVELPQTARASVASNDSVFSVLTVDESAVRTVESAGPVYPADLIAAGVEGVVVARYVIDTTGHVDPLTVDLLPGSNPGFVRAVREALPGMLFHPAMVHERPVRQQVEQNFVFRIQPAAVAPAAPAEHTRATPGP